MSLKKNNPGCDCCGGATCSIGADDFNRSDDTDIGSDWSEEAGDWEIVSNRLFTSDADAYAEYQTPHPDSEAYFYVKVDIEISVGDKAQVYLSDNVIIEVERFSSSIYYINFYDDGALTSTQDFNLTAGSYSYSIYYGEGGGLASLSFGNKCAAMGISSTPSSYTVGLGTGDSNVSGIYFDNFVLEKGMSSSNPTCTSGCWSCSGCSTMPPTPFLVSVAGFPSSSSGGCSDCSAINGTYALFPGWQLALTFGGWNYGVPCNWGNEFDFDCDGTPMTLFIHAVYSVTDTRWYGTVAMRDIYSDSVSFGLLTGSDDCDDNVVLPVRIGGFGLYCHPTSSATFEVNP